MTGPDIPIGDELEAVLAQTADLVHYLDEQFFDDFSRLLRTRAEQLIELQSLLKGDVVHQGLRDLADMFEDLAAGLRSAADPGEAS